MEAQNWTGAHESRYQAQDACANTDASVSANGGRVPGGREADEDTEANEADEHTGRHAVHASHAVSDNCSHQVSRRGLHLLVAVRGRHVATREAVREALRANSRRAIPMIDDVIIDADRHHAHAGNGGMGQGRGRPGPGRGGERGGGRGGGRRGRGRYPRLTGAALCGVQREPPWAAAAGGGGHAGGLAIWLGASYFDACHMQTWLGP